MRGSLKVEGYGYDIKEFQGVFHKTAGGPWVDRAGRDLRRRSQIGRRARSWTRAVDQVHWSTVDQTKGFHPNLI
jgi:hypothetical protein